MKKQVVFFSVFILFTFNICEAQSFFRTADLFRNTGSGSGSGELNIFQDLRVDSLISRYVLANRLLEGGDMEGYRIQIFRNANRNAQEEANKVRMEFIQEFPDISSTIEFAAPGYFLVRVGDFRTKMEATKSLYLIRKKYPNAYTVPCLIRFPDLNKK